MSLSRACLSTQTHRQIADAQCSHTHLDTHVQRAHRSRMTREHKQSCCRSHTPHAHSLQHKLSTNNLIVHRQTPTLSYDAEHNKSSWPAIPAPVPLAAATSVVRTSRQKHRSHTQALTVVAGTAAAAGDSSRRSTTKHECRYAIVVTWQRHAWCA
jgi:hypothetical protein